MPGLRCEEDKRVVASRRNRRQKRRKLMHYLTGEQINLAALAGKNEQIVMRELGTARIARWDHKSKA